MATRDTIVIGASAGGVQALSKLVADLPEDLRAAVFIVLHVPSDVPSLLPGILSRDSRLPVAHARNGEEIRPEIIYVAPPNRHLLIQGALEEQMLLARRIVERARKANHARAAQMFEERAREAEANSSIIRQLLLGDEKGDIADPVIVDRDQLVAS